jgi:hypothetical protein
MTNPMQSLVNPWEEVPNLAVSGLGSGRAGCASAYAQSLPRPTYLVGGEGWAVQGKSKGGAPPRLGAQVGQNGRLGGVVSKMHDRRNSLSPSTERSRRRRRLAKEMPRRDPISYSDLPLPKSIRSEIIEGLIGKGLTVRRGADEADMTTAEWRKKSGWLIALFIVRTLIEKDNCNALRLQRFLAVILTELKGGV